MASHIWRRLLIAVPVVLGVTIINYLIINLAPGSPVDALVDPSAGIEARQALERQLGLDQPIYVRYVAWLGQTLHGNLGYSYADYRPVTQKIGERIGPTVALTATAFALAFTAALVLGTLSAVYVSSWIDFLATFSGILGVSIPSFFFGLGAIYLLSLRVPIFPSGGMLQTGAPFSLADFGAHLILPAVALALFDIGSLVRYARASMLEVLHNDYVRTARAKGLNERQVMARHAIRNGLNPLITQAGLAIPRLLGGAVVVESVFQWPGMGRLAIEAILQRDYPVLMGINLMIAVLVILGSLLADLLYGVADPRIRVG
jgi:peptide/nickel transport system permease protein